MPLSIYARVKISYRIERLLAMTSWDQLPNAPAKISYRIERLSSSGVSSCSLARRSLIELKVVNMSYVAVPASFTVKISYRIESSGI